MSRKMTKPPLKKVMVGDIICCNVMDTPIFGTVLEKRFKETLNERTGRWRYAAQVFVKWEDLIPDCWLQDTNWETEPLYLASRAAKDWSL